MIETTGNAINRTMSPPTIYCGSATLSARRSKGWCEMESNEERNSEETESITSGVCGQVENVDTSNELNNCKVLGYGIGHFYNDLCASMWFTYLLLFLEKVIIMRNSVAGLIMLIGQTTDALSTAFIGVLSDLSSVPFCFRHCGQRKSWHALGTVLVTFSFAFIYNKCFICDQLTTDWKLFAWYAPYVIVFQIGWAAVQISHLALLPELTYDESRRTTMNSVRHGFTVVANLIIFAVLSVLLYLDDSGSAVGPRDLRHFNIVAGMVIVLGLVTGIIFYTVIKEPSRNGHIIVSTSLRYQCGILDAFKLSLLKWMCRFQFYQVGMLYVLCRLYINISQVYFPFYITHLPNLSKSLALLGCLCGFSNCLVIQFDAYFPIYINAVLLGATQAILLITSLSAVAKLIRQDTGSGAFVYGILSSMDKISNGIVLQMIELFSPSSCMTRDSAVDCTSFYRMMVVVTPISCLLIAFFPIFGDDSLSNLNSSQQSYR
uniref:Uncharacterized protein n=1 Tax=Onchocerca volvulus TaxID=6282 RepID=A0A8R1TWG9_ONCVO